ncbi:hypothetical protein QJS66_18110 [Kocuria rhizophila]|nr:hypothetical protein QJS66_18110 [Kocuria rhizophila]
MLGALFILVVNIEAVPAAFAAVFHLRLHRPRGRGRPGKPANRWWWCRSVARGIFSNGPAWAPRPLRPRRREPPTRCAGLVSMTPTFMRLTIVVVALRGPRDVAPPGCGSRARISRPP